MRLYRSGLFHRLKPDSENSVAAFCVRVQESNLHLYLREAKRHNVTDLVRVCEECYPAKEVEAAGITMHVRWPVMDSHLSSISHTDSLARAGCMQHFPCRALPHYADILKSCKYL